MRPTISRLERFPSSVELRPQPGGGFASTALQSGPVLRSDPGAVETVVVTFELPHSAPLEFSTGGKVLVHHEPPPRTANPILVRWALSCPEEPEVDFILVQVYVAYATSPHLRHGRAKVIRVVVKG